MSPERRQRIKEIAEPVRQIGQILGVAACVYFSGTGRENSSDSLQALTRIEQKMETIIHRTDRMDLRIDRLEDATTSINSKQWQAINEIKLNISNQQNIPR